MPFSPALARAMTRAKSGRPTFRKIGKLVNSPADGRHVLMAAIACSSNAQGKPHRLHKSSPLEGQKPRDLKKGRAFRYRLKPAVPGA
jgi:hypothetical protein